MKVRLRKAVAADVPRLRVVIEASVRGLQAGDYSAAQIESALQSVYGVDSQLIADGTYFVAEVMENPHSAKAALQLRSGQPRDGTGSAEGVGLIVGCGGWSRRKTLYGGDQFSGREDSLLDPARDAAKIRAFFVHPEWARRGIGGMILQACENAAVAAGFRRLEMGSTLTGVAFYKSKGYYEVETQEAPLADGGALPIVRMTKDLSKPHLRGR